MKQATSKLSKILLIFGFKILKKDKELSKGFSVFEFLKKIVRTPLLQMSGIGMGFFPSLFSETALFKKQVWQ